MELVTIELGIRKFRVPIEKARLIDQILLGYTAQGMGRLMILRHLIGFDQQDLAAFHEWKSAGAIAVTTRFTNQEDFRIWDKKLQAIAEQITIESKLRIPF